MRIEKAAIVAVMDPKAMLWNHPPPPPRQSQLGELLFEFLRASDRAPMSCELRFHGESWGWEAQFYERGEFWYGRRFDLDRRRSSGRRKSEKRWRREPVTVR